jgi:hypothetical protein
MLMLCSAAGCTGGLAVRIILAADIVADLDAMLGARIGVAEVGREALPTGRRADFAAFLFGAPALLLIFLSGRWAVLDDRLAVFVE